MPSAPMLSLRSDRFSTSKLLKLDCGNEFGPDSLVWEVVWNLDESLEFLSLTSPFPVSFGITSDAVDGAGTIGVKGESD